MARSRSADARSLLGSVSTGARGGAGVGSNATRGSSTGRLGAETGQTQDQKVLKRSEAVAADISPAATVGTASQQRGPAAADAEDRHSGNGGDHTLGHGASLSNERTVPLREQRAHATQPRRRSLGRRTTQHTSGDRGAANGDDAEHDGRGWNTRGSPHLRGPTLRTGNSAEVATTSNSVPHRRVSMVSPSPVRGRSSGSGHMANKPDEYVIVQVRLKEHAMFHGSPRHKCHFVEYWEQGEQQRRTLVGVSRPLEDLVLTWSHVDAESPIVPHRDANVRRQRRTSAAAIGATERNTSGSTADSMAHHRHAGGGSQRTDNGSGQAPSNRVMAGLLQRNALTGVQAVTRDRSTSSSAVHGSGSAREQRGPRPQQEYQPEMEADAEAATLCAGKRVPLIRTSTFDQSPGPANPSTEGKGGNQAAYAAGADRVADGAVRTDSTETTTAGKGTAPKVVHSAESHAAPGHSENERLEQRKPAFVVLALPTGELAGSGVYHFIRVLRSATLSPDALLPIVVLAGEEWQLSQRLRKFMALFPLVYYHVGRLETPRSLLRACLRGAKVVLVLAPGVRDLNVENCMIDAPNIMATQNVHDVFPDITVLTELTHRPNVKFVRFVAAAPEDLQQSLSVEEMQGADDAPSPALQTATSMALHRMLANATFSAAATWRKRFQSRTAAATEFLFRQSYASGQVFSTTMLDAVLYQSMRPEKESLLEVYRLLLGCEDGNNFLSLRPITEDLMHRRKLTDYGDLCRYFILKKQAIVLGLKIERVMARSAHESHSKNLFARLKQAPRARLSRTMSGFVLQAILPNPDENFAIHPGDSVFLLQRRLDWRNIHKGVRGMNLTPRQKAVGLLTQYRPSVMAKRWLHMARESRGERDHVKAAAQGPDDEQEEEGGKQQQGSKLREWMTGARTMRQDKEEEPSFDDGGGDDRGEDVYWGRGSADDEERALVNQRPFVPEYYQPHQAEEARGPVDAEAQQRQQQEAQTWRLRPEESSTSTPHESKSEGTATDTYETIV